MRSPARPLPEATAVERAATRESVLGALDAIAVGPRRFSLVVPAGARAWNPEGPAFCGSVFVVYQHWPDGSVSARAQRVADVVR